MDPRAAQAEHLERREDRHVRLVADDDVDLRRTEEALLLDVPAISLKQRVARGCETREVGHGRAGRESDARTCR